jgi:SAM-dependent methyltransferase
VRALGLFDEGWYRAAYPDVPAAGDALWHFASWGARAGRDPNPLFSTSWYLTTYPDVAEAGVDPLVHYLTHGADEGRDPGPGFDTAWYLGSNADVRAAGVNPLAHYLTHGEGDGRTAVPPRPARGAAGAAVVLVSGEPDTPGHRYRVDMLAEAVRRLGGRADVFTVPQAATTGLAAVDRADAVVLWRTVWGDPVERVVRRARRVGAAVVFDVDDLMFDPALATVDVIDGIRSQGLTEEDVADWYGRMRRTAEAADACIGSTPGLAAHLRAVGKPAYVLENGFDEAIDLRSRLAARTRRAVAPDGLCRIGYPSGSRTHQRDFAVAAGAVADVLRAHPHTRLVLVADTIDLAEFPDLDGLADRVEWRRFVPLSDLPVELARLDVVLAPLEVGNAFCEAKSALKFFEAALVDVPTVASPTEPYRAVVRSGENGFLATTRDEWRAAIDGLVRDPGLRAEVGRAARRSVLWPQGPERRAETVHDVLDQVLDRGPVAARAFARMHAPPAAPAPPPETGDARVVVEHDRLRPSRVTVVVPVHDYAGVVTEALDSVRAQTLDDLDLVVVDDASGDGSLPVVVDWVARHHARFNRVVVLAHRTNGGLARARNSGCDAAETPFVLPLDADNMLLPGCAERLLAALDDSGAAFAYPRIRHVGDPSPLFPDGHVRGYLPYVPQRLVGSNYIDAMALVRTSAWAAAGGYRPGHGWEDYDLWCRFAEAGRYGVQVAEDLALYRVHGGSMLHTVTHQGTRLRTARTAIAGDHPWLRLDPEDAPLDDPAAADDPAPAAPPATLRTNGARTDGNGHRPARPGPDPGSGPASAPVPGRLSDRARAVLPLLRCPATGEPLEEDPGGGVRSVGTGRRWPVVAGRPVLVPGGGAPAVVPGDHRGNPLPDRARDLVAAAAGPILHLSGGGTAAGDERVVEADGAVFGPTHVVVDAHRLPFADATFDLVVAMNAFEHYRDPPQVVRQLHRVLRPGGLVLVHTAFLQPLHEAPHHYFNVTRHGLAQWFARFETVDLRVSDNFHPGYTLSWLASDAEDAVAADLSDADAARLRRTPLGELADLWRDPATRERNAAWSALAGLGQAHREALAAGFEYLGRR